MIFCWRIYTPISYLIKSRTKAFEIIKLLVLYRELYEWVYSNLWFIHKLSERNRFDLNIVRIVIWASQLEVSLTIDFMKYYCNYEIDDIDLSKHLL